MSTDVVRCDRIGVELVPNRYGTFSVHIRLYMGDKLVRDEMSSGQRPRAAALRDMTYANELIALRLSRGNYVLISGESPDIKVD